jgi:rhamnosyltransferase subunit B
MCYLFASVGTLGDALRYLELAREMQMRGHLVSFFSNEQHSALTQQLGVVVESAGSNVRYHEALQDANLWHSVNGMGVSWRTILLPSIEPLYLLIQELQGQGKKSRVVAGPHMLGVKLAEEHLGTDLVSVYTALGMVRNFTAPTTIAYNFWPREAPRWLLKWFWKKPGGRKR